MTSKRRREIRRRRKQKNRNKNRFLRWFKSLGKGKKAALIACAILLLLVVVVVLFAMSKFAKLDRQKIDKNDIVINQFEEPVGEGYTNFVLFGGDSRNGDVDRDLNTDTIIIVSLNNATKEVKMVSVYRDTLLDVSNGSIRKCNSAYPQGGATQAINMLNMNLDLNIQQYATVSFGAVSDVIDMLGGIEVDVSEREWQEVNKYIDETGMVAGKKAKHLTHGGVQTLDGVQATTYARIRKNVGDDYARTERQRLIIQLAVEKAMKADFSTLNKIVDKVFPQISTNLSMTDILKYAKDITKYKFGETTGFPIERGGAVIPGKGDCVFPVTLKKNVTLLHKFLYGTEDYKPSSKVASISDAIANVVGNRQADPNTTWKNPGTSTDPENPGTTDPKNPGAENPENPGGEDPNNPGGEDPNNPGGEDPNNPGGEDPNNPGGEDPNNPGGEDPNNPGTNPENPETGNTGTGGQTNPT